MQTYINFLVTQSPQNRLSSWQKIQWLFFTGLHFANAGCTSRWRGEIGGQKSYTYTAQINMYHLWWKVSAEVRGFLMKRKTWHLYFNHKFSLSCSDIPTNPREQGPERGTAKVQGTCSTWCQKRDYHVALKYPGIFSSTIRYELFLPLSSQSSTKRQFEVQETAAQHIFFGWGAVVRSNKKQYHLAGFHWIHAPLNNSSNSVPSCHFQLSKPLVVLAMLARDDFLSKEKSGLHLWSPCYRL